MIKDIREDQNIDFFTKQYTELLDKYDELKLVLDNPNIGTHGNPMEIYDYCKSLKDIENPMGLALGGSNIPQLQDVFS